MRSVRLSMGLNEADVAAYLGVSLEKYSIFEDKPIIFSGRIVAKYIEFLQSIPDADNLDQMFLEFARFDLKEEVGESDVFNGYPLRLVDATEDIAI